MRIKKNIFRNLRTRFDLDVTPPIDLNPTIQLISNIDPLWTYHEIIDDDCTGCTELVSTVTVPKDEKWVLRWASIFSGAQHPMSATITGGASEITIIPLQDVFNAIAETRNLTLMPGWVITMIVQAGVASTIRNSIYVEKEKWVTYVEL